MAQAVRTHNRSSSVLRAGSVLNIVVQFEPLSGTNSRTTSAWRQWLHWLQMRFLWLVVAAIAVCTVYTGAPAPELLLAYCLTTSLAIAFQCLQPERTQSRRHLGCSITRRERLRLKLRLQRKHKTVSTFSLLSFVASIVMFADAVAVARCEWHQCLFAVQSLLAYQMALLFVLFSHLLLLLLLGSVVALAMYNID